jgi:hemerythrin-like domain-containing protein
MEKHDTGLPLFADRLAEFHQESASHLESLEGVIRAYRAAGQIEGRARREIIAVRKFLKQVAEPHFRQVEEEIFPPVLRAHGEGGPVALMLYDHRVLHHTIRRFVRAVDHARVRGFEPGEETARLIRVAEEVGEKMADHLDKEERLLLPLVRELPLPAGS